VIAESIGVLFAVETAAARLGAGVPDGPRQSNGH
jgi:hypothetical protein